MDQKVLHIGIMPYQDYKKRSLAIARGEYRPRPDEPKIWFESVQSMAQVLSNENQVLLKIILERKPESFKDLEAATGRSSSNLSRTLKTMARYGIVRMEKVRAAEPQAGRRSDGFHGSVRALHRTAQQNWNGRRKELRDPKLMGTRHVNFH